MSSMTLSSLFDALLLDLDGTVWAGELALPGSVESIVASQLPALYITNNASRGPADVAAKLRAAGLDASPEDVVTSAQAAVSLVSQNLNAGDPILVVGAPSFKDLVREAGFRVVESADEKPVAVLQGHNPETGWAQLSEAALAIANGARYVVSNLDTTLPSERGLLVGNGSMVAAVTSATGVVPTSAGKPEPAMFLQAAQRAGAKRPLAVGDRLDTDIAGAVAAGIPALHVLTGVSGPLALLEAPREFRPTFIADGMAALGHEPESLRPRAQGGFSARVDGHDIILSRGNPGATSTEALLTVLEVAWLMEEPPALVRPNSDAAEEATAQWW